MKIQAFFSASKPVEQVVFRILYAIIIAAGLLNFSSCFKKDYAPGSQTECQHCNEDVDCCCGMKCSGFYNNSGVYFRCATAQTSTCPE